MRQKSPPNGSGQSESSEKPSSPTSQPTKKNSENSKDKEAESQLKTGLKNPSEDNPKTSSLERENEPSSNNREVKEPKLLPLPKPIKGQDRTKEALKRLGVKQEELDKVPQITPQLKKAAGGLKAVLNAMRFSSEDQDIAAFLEKYDSIPSGDRERLPWEAVCISAGIQVKHLLGAIHIALQNNSVSTVKILAVTHHPKVVKARIKFSQLAGGEKDRTALDTAMGFLPSPKGPTFIGKQIIGGGSVNSSSSSDDDEEVAATAMFDDDGDLDRLFPPASAAQDKIIAIRQKLLDR